MSQRNLIREYYQNYIDSQNGFAMFHNQVINMPRDGFSNVGLLKIKQLCAYIALLDEGQLNQTTDYKQIMNNISSKLRSGKYPVSELRNNEFEGRYFNIAVDINTLYEKWGRMFRHLMGLLSFFGVIRDDGSRIRKIIDTDALREILLVSNDTLTEMFRNIILNININSNAYIKNLQGITLLKTADYKPAINILRYCKEINRPATLFEISILLGRIDNLQTENEIFMRAMEIGKLLPTTQDAQISHFFGNMGWKSGTTLFTYAPSQEPYFKFKSFILYLETFGFIEINNTYNTIINTQYSDDLLQEELPFELLDLDNLLKKIDDDDSDDNELANIVLRKRTETISKAIQDDTLLVEKFNKRAIRNPIIKNDKRKRNRIIMELAKIKANYCDELLGQYTFIGQSGNGYVEAHHLIEFSKENGPDITDNLICFVPDNHSRIHHGSTETVEDLYRDLIVKGVITIERFKKISNTYKCLTKEHITILRNKNLISNQEKEELLLLVEQNGVDDDFLNSLKIAASE